MDNLRGHLRLHEIRPRVLRGKRAGSVGRAIKRSVSDDGASMDARWTSNGCSPLRRTHTTRIAHRFALHPRFIIRAKLEARHSSPNCVQLAPKLFFLPIITSCACIYTYTHIYICISLLVAIKRHCYNCSEGQSGLNSSLKVSLLLRMRLRSP